MKGTSNLKDKRKRKFYWLISHSIPHFNYPQSCQIQINAKTHWGKHRSWLLHLIPHILKSLKNTQDFSFTVGFGFSRKRTAGSLGRYSRKSVSKMLTIQNQKPARNGGAGSFYFYSWTITSMTFNITEYKVAKLFHAAEFAALIVKKVLEYFYRL
jgi:hypothetical protein